MEPKVNILDELNKFRPEIDKLILQYVPREYDERSLEFLLGKTQFKYCPEAMTVAFSKPAWEFLEHGGKRWRPALFFLVVDALKGDRKKAGYIAPIIELVHNGTLVHDDIEDGSLNRRGFPCMHIAHGEDIAVNAGHLMYYVPVMSLIKHKGEFDPKIFAKLLEIYITEMTRVGAGQATDIAWHRNLAHADSISEDEYLQMCYNKTGCLARMAMQLAAAVCNSSDDVIQKLGNLAATVGVAFQIQDDILNLVGEKEKFVGKDIGEDITEGKRTLMVIYTLKIADEKDKKRLLELLHKHTKDQKEIIGAIQIMKKHGSIDYAKKRARDLLRGAWKEAEKCLPSNAAKDKIKAFVEFLVEREV